MNDKEKKRLDRQELNRIAMEVLRVARMLMEHGAETRRVFETAREIGFAMGAEELHFLVTHRSIMVTVTSGEEAVTRIVRVGTLGVDFWRVSAISGLFHRMKQGLIGVGDVEGELVKIGSSAPQYPRILVLLAVGLACAGFAGIGGGDPACMCACIIAASIGLYVRQTIVHLQFQPMLGVFSAAFVSATLASLIARYAGSHNVGIAMAASVLYLVPGVPMINSVADLVKGHLLTGFTRALTVVLTAVFVAMGLISSMRVLGFDNY
jgi:uncharacterized membrane protein YjjP (DUF1212 family)